MPDVREKLVELIVGALEDAQYDCGVQTSCKECQVNEYKKYNCCIEVMAANNLIANGVTVQEWNGCEYCKEDSEGYRKMIGAFSITNPFHGNVWNIETRHCKPRQIYFCPMCGRRLPQPPKGE